MKKLSLLIIICLITGCAPKYIQSEPEVVTKMQVVTIQPPGVTQYIWEAPLVDVVDVPPGLDPEGHYYRPSHQEVVEIRQGRWQYHQDK